MVGVLDAGNDLTIVQMEENSPFQPLIDFVHPELEAAPKGPPAPPASVTPTTAMLSLEAADAPPAADQTSVLAAAMAYPEVGAATNNLNAAKQQVVALKHKVKECAAKENFLEAAGAQVELEKKSDEMSTLKLRRESVIADCLEREQQRRDQAIARTGSINDLENRLNPLYCLSRILKSIDNRPSYRSLNGPLINR